MKGNKTNKPIVTPTPGNKPDMVPVAIPSKIIKNISIIICILKLGAGRGVEPHLRVMSPVFYR